MFACDSRGCFSVGVDLSNENISWGVPLWAWGPWAQGGRLGWVAQYLLLQLIRSPGGAPSTPEGPDDAQV
jgi:hypothetical protein